MAASNLSQTLLDLQKASLYPVFQAVVEYLENRDDDSPLTVDELCEGVLEMKVSANISLVVQNQVTSPSGKKVVEKDEVNGCQRVMGGTSKRPGHCCGAKIYKDKATGEPAQYCLKCIKLKSFRGMAKKQLEEWGMSIDEATAGFLTDFAVQPQVYAPGPYQTPPPGQYTPPPPGQYTPPPGAPQARRIVHAPRKRMPMPAV